ncbi:hypothetical protein Taro_035073 [Colocasia esculenta]|uniref:Uncharacterized protein n=1 Tax=Colocasia esculenta TaxID=4460 RepID=A0A843W4P5_COLES|nr:hypothetical protein [Colocasia esculenta]
MAKRSREDEGALPEAHKARHEKPTKPSPAAFCRGASDGEGATERAIDSLPKPGIAGNGVELQVTCGAGLAVAGLPRWWQLWVGRGGGMVVDCEELLWGWFPFVDEDFSCDGGRPGWVSCWGDVVEGQLLDVFYDDIWQLKHIYEIPGHAR